MLPSESADTREFIDSTYGYSIQVPTAWRPHRLAAPTDRPPRLSLITPSDSMLIVSVDRLPQRVTGPSDFESVGENHVDSVVDAYRQSFGLTTVMGEQKDNQSDGRSLRYWQGTSAIHESMAPVMLISLHAVSFGSDVLVNILYISGVESTEEVRAVDALMKSLSFVTE